MIKLTDDISEFAKAHCAALAEMTDAKRDQKAYNYDYADLAQVLSIIRPIFTRNGLTIIQGILPSNKPDHTVLETIVLHTSGQGVSFAAECKVDGKSNTAAQALGSVVSYLRRYSLMCIAGMAQADSTPEEEGEVSKNIVVVAKQGSNVANAFRSEMQANLIQPRTVELIEQLLIDTKIAEHPGKWIDWLKAQGANEIFDLTESQALLAVKMLKKKVSQG